METKLQTDKKQLSIKLQRNIQQMSNKRNTRQIAACPHTFSFGGTCTPRDWHLGVQAKIWESVIGVHTSTASRLIHGNSLYHYDQRSFLLPEFAFAKVCNFIVWLRLTCSFRQLNLLCRCGFITVLRFMFFTNLENLRVLLYAISVWRHGFYHVVKRAAICDWTT